MKAFVLAVQTPAPQRENAAQCFLSAANLREPPLPPSLSFPLLLSRQADSSSPWVYIWYKKRMRGRRSVFSNSAERSKSLRKKRKRWYTTVKPWAFFLSPTIQRKRSSDGALRSRTPHGEPSSGSRRHGRRSRHGHHLACRRRSLRHGRRHDHRSRRGHRRACRW